MLADIRDNTGISYVFVSHALAVLRQITDHCIAMRQGQVVETGPTEKILDALKHPHTQLLRASVPGPGWQPRRRSTTDMEPQMNTQTA